MNNQSFTILLIEDNPGDAHLLRELVRETGDSGITLVSADRLSIGLQQLDSGVIDAILLDLSLPDSAGLTTIHRVRAHAPQVPVLVLTGLDDEVIAMQAMQAGAQDYLAKGRMDGFGLVRALRYAIERQHALAQIEHTSQALRDSEARLAGIINSATDAIITIDQEQCIKLFNPAAEQMFGCSAGEVLGTSIDRFIPAGLREVHRTHIHNFGTTNVINRRVNKLGVIKGLRANGEEFPIEAAISQLETAGQKVYTVMLRDITEQLHAQEQILLLNAELEQRVVARTAELLAAINDLEAFSYSVSHDLRAPLRAIDGFTRILLEEYASNFPEEAQHYFQRVRDNTQQMGQLIDDLLAFSRLSRQPLMKRSVDMAALIHQCLAELQPEQEGRQVAIRITELPNCQGDAALLKQVWTNLLTNALKYTRQRDSALITIDYQTDGAVMIYFIRDNGVGFDMRYSDKLFGVFQRLHRSADYEGTGVGLAIVQRIIQRHGGRIWAAAIPDQGATFFFTLEELPPQ